MRTVGRSILLILLFAVHFARAQAPEVEPRIVTRPLLEETVTEVAVAPRFFTAIQLPEPVNSIAVGDPSAFQVEHSEKEPRVVFVKALTTRPAKTDLFISTASGRETSLLLVAQGENVSRGTRSIDLLVRFEARRGFLIEPTPLPFALIGQTIPLQGSAISDKPLAIGPSENEVVEHVVPVHFNSEKLLTTTSGSANLLDQLLDQQRRAAVPRLYGERIEVESKSGDRIRAGVGSVIDRGEQVIVLFSVVNPTTRSVLVMPPQVQLGGRTTTGKLIRHSRWSTAEQLSILDFRLSRRRLGPGDRADGVVLFVRPPYKQSTEMLFLQMAESGAVDRPALAPIGFGVSQLIGGK